MNKVFTESLKDSNSDDFKNLKKTVEAKLLPTLRETLPSVVDIDVYAFKRGSTVAEYNIILDDDATAINASTTQSAVQEIISNGNLTSLNVDTSFVPPIEGKHVDFMFDSLDIGCYKSLFVVSISRHLRDIR